jgi:multidrug resistance efflux pump
MSRNRIILYAVVCLVPLIAALWIAGVDPYGVLGLDVSTSNAYITGTLLQASAPASGSVSRILTEVGDPVDRGQVVAYLLVPVQTNTQLPIIPEVRAPGPGTVVHLSVLQGQTVTTGQPVATIANLSQLYVIAGIDESSFSTVRPGDRSEVYVPALNETFAGRVDQLLPDPQQLSGRTGAVTGSTGATAASTSSAGQVPVRIDFDYGAALVYPGMSAQVTIYTR